MRHNRGDYDGAAEAFLLYTKAGGKVFKGLVNRRNDERATYLS
jgi:GH24 family phage-related lysozyme (muramidase)